MKLREGIIPEILASGFTMKTAANKNLAVDATVELSGQPRIKLTPLFTSKTKSGNQLSNHAVEVFTIFNGGIQNPGYLCFVQTQ